MAKRKRQTARILWIASLAFFLGSIYLFYDNLLVAGLFGLVVSFFLAPTVRALLRQHHYNRNALIGVPLCALALMVASYVAFKPGEKDIPSLLKEYTHVSGTKVDNFQDMSYMVDPHLRPVKKEGEIRYYPVKGQPIPVLIVSHVDNASCADAESFLSRYISGQLGSDGAVSNVLTEDYEVNGRPSQMATYAYTLTKKEKGDLSADLIGETFLAPIEGGVYVMSFFTYAADFNDYGYLSLVDTIDLYRITHLLDVREEMKAYLTKHACPQDAYQSECDEFAKYRSALQTALDEEKPIEELEAAKAAAVTYENAIKARIQKDKEDQAYLNKLYSGEIAVDETGE